MCVAAVAWNAHPHWRLVVAANRDEYHERPTDPLSRWADGTIAGKDLRAGGTWLGINEAGRFALVTNHRVEGFPKPDRLSRGGLVTDWLAGEAHRDITAMNPFNLICVGQEGLLFTTNWPEEQRDLSAGVYGISNGPFDRPWPKARQLCSALSDWLDSSSDDFTPLFTALGDESGREPVDTHLTDPEPRLSGIFIRDAAYGTRCSTVIAVDAQGHGRIVERRFNASARQEGETQLEFCWA